MAFSFGLPIVPQDPGGVDLGSALARLTGGAPVTYAQAPQPMPDQAQVAPQPDPQAQALQAQAQPWKPSIWDIAQGMLFNGGAGLASPNQAAQKAYQNHYALQQSQLLMQAMQNASPAQQMAMILNPAETGKALADRLATHTLNGGQTLVNGGVAGSPFTATTYGMDNGVGYALGPNVPGGLALSSQRAPGETKVDAESGGLYNNNGPIAGQQFSRWHTYEPQQTAGDGFAGVRGAQPGFPVAGAAPAPAVPLPASVTAQAGNAPQGAAPGRFDALNFIKSFIIPHEGGLNPHDMNGAPTKFGINQAANPGVNVANLTADQAADIYMHKYLPMSGAANLPPALAAVHLDTSIINPARAQQFLQQSNGDPAAYLALRQQWMQHMLQTNPAAAPYANAWNQRNADLGKLIAGQGAGAAAPQASAAPAQPGDAAPSFNAVHTATPLRTATQDELRAAGLPADAVAMVKPNGDLDVKDPGLNNERLIAMRGQLADKEPIKNYQQAQDAYGAMIRAAAQPNGGMRAYALRDTFARAINPGAVARSGTIEAIKESQGIPANVKAYFMNLRGDGDVPPEIAQQILDTTHSFVVSHYTDAKAMNNTYGDYVAKRHGDPADVMVNIGDEPPRMALGQVPPPQQRAPDTIYSTPKGPLLWTGQGWRKIN